MRKIELNLKLLISIILPTFLLLAFVYADPTNSNKQYKNTPTLFIHGYKGGPRSFETMLRRFEQKQLGEKAMVIHVAPNGNMAITGNLAKQYPSFIQVIFQNNRATIAQQTQWVRKILHQLKEVYHVQQVNVVGHSMGGLTATNVILQNKDSNAIPTIKKLVVIASPFKGIDNPDYFFVNTGPAAVDLKTESEALKKIIANRESFDPTIKVLTIAGVIDKTGTDGLVSLSSAMGIEEIVNKDQIQREIFYDKQATHSGLHEHTGVDQKIATFLWK
ncbi:PGAP1-like protein [Paraliobacillus sp. PM-2]|uniref:alpha/beta fold hydrolase n=1 Tax=Paraliobacillus sp. PM-2 TaxID=1462524 RepID=UPI00061CA8EC|nr:alpha/beta fold hydrolase [Paraliobacillus sp. PM-2]CQR48403.1 PGAP1-like protein [Paraliobacillus sp. PM-2]